MCGIAGIWSANKDEISLNRLKLMTDAIEHRGPQGEGFWLNTEGQLGFGHRRLAIIDLSAAGAQPMHYGGRYSIVYNGEIYNYLELRLALEQRGFSFHSSTDTEVILAAYACYGRNCLQQFDGMFSFAIWDQQRQTLFAARDRFGEKPFYYHLDSTTNTLFFASEMKALWAAGVRKTTNHKMLLAYLSLGYVQNPVDKSETFYENIYSLPPACFLEIDVKDHSVYIEKYYSTAIISGLGYPSQDLASRAFFDSFQESVRLRLRSDVPLGCSLSGGIDSSSIAAIMSKLSAEDLSSFSAIFPGFEKDESAYIKRMSNARGIKNFTVEPQSEDLVRDFEDLCHHQEEPFPSSSIYTQYRVYQLAKKYHVTVLLDGQGADEILGGYTKHIHWFLQELFITGRKQQMKQELAALKKNRIPVEWSWKNKLAARLPVFASKVLRQKARKEIVQNSGLNGEFIDAFYDEDRTQKPVIQRADDILLYNTNTFGLEELLRFSDRNSMAHSREVRLPFLSHKLVDLVFSMPLGNKFYQGFTKYVLRNSMKTMVPAEICWRTDKIGFEPPQKRWMSEKMMQGYLYESKVKLAREGILKKSMVEKKIQPRDAHAAENFDWRYMVTAGILL